MEEKLTMVLKKTLFFILSSLLVLSVFAQKETEKSFFQKADSLNKTRFWLCAGTGAAIYSGFTIGLYKAWYKDYPTSRFHTFNDWKEWNRMDKAGHLFTTHMECNLAMEGALWTGMDRSASMWTAAGIGLGLQLTLETMDGFSEKWGFSGSDMGFNALGAGLFISQELLWQEQRILMKVSSNQSAYSRMPFYSIDGGAQSSLAERAGALYGYSFAEKFLKDYNALTVWASVNVVSFMGENRKNTLFPKWLNVAVGYGSENLYGGFENEWDGEGHLFSLDEMHFPRYTQFYLSLDVDFSRIRTRNHFLKTLLKIVNWIKVPAPAMEFNTQGQIKFHPLYW